jgi:translation initiation factor IF-3
MSCPKTIFWPLEAGRRHRGYNQSNVALHPEGLDLNPARAELAYAVIKRVRAELDPLARVESEPSFEGRQMIMILAAK